MRGLILLLAGVVLCAGPAHAADALDRIRADGVLRCGAVERPGIAEAPPTGGAVGIAVDVCRALAIAVLGPAGRVDFTFYEAPHSFDPLRNGTDELAFLTGNEIAEQKLGRDVLPGPTIAVTEAGVMVPDASPVRHLTGLSGQTVCMMIGSAAQRALEAAAIPLHLSIARLMFQEDVEMLDAYNAGRCGAVAGEATYLAEMRLTPGVRGLTSRLLPESLGGEPIVAVTSPADGAWAARVAWVFNALLLADAPASPWHASGENTMPVEALSGLRPAWMHDVTVGVGSYTDIIRRNLTGRLGLPAGPNAVWPAGLMMPIAVR